MNVETRAAVATREQILSRIFAVLGSVSGVQNVFRNRGEMSQDQLPAIVLLDGREDIVSQVAPLKSVKMTPAIFRLQPEIYVILEQRDDSTNATLKGEYRPIGPDLSLYRDLVLAALINDPTLVQMLTTTGQIVYRGCESDMASGRTMIGELRLFIDFHYIWFPPTA